MKKRRTINMGKIIAVGIIGLLVCSGMASVSAKITELYAGNPKNDPTVAGNVYLSRVGNELIVTYLTQDGWTIEETALLVTLPSNLASYLTKSGNPKIGQFKKTSGPPTSVSPTEVVYTIDLTVLFPGGWSGETLILAAHAVVSHPDFGEETAWADTWGQSFPGSSWALYLSVLFR